MVIHIEFYKNLMSSFISRFTVLENQLYYPSAKAGILLNLIYCIISCNLDRVSIFFLLLYDCVRGDFLTLKTDDNLSVWTLHCTVFSASLKRWKVADVDESAEKVQIAT